MSFTLTRLQQTDMVELICRIFVAMKTAFVYSKDFSKYDYGSAHPLKTLRLKMTYDLIQAYGLLTLENTRYVEAASASDDDILLFHEKKYIDTLDSVNGGTAVAGAEAYGLGPGDNPVFRGLYDWSKLVTGASLKAAELVDDGGANIAFNISGGLHHALPSRASGFCYVNDPAVAIMWLLKRGRKVAYIDIDAHHGDGVQEAFYDTDRVLTISIHETGRMLFPGGGFADEIGRDKGLGYSVNIPMPPYSDDELFLYAFNETVPCLIEKFRPDVIVTQLGVDSFRYDPLAHLNYTTNGFCEVVQKIKDIAPKWVALGGGGYDLSNVAKAWTLAWAIMNDTDIPEDFPEDFLRKYPLPEFQSRKIKDQINRMEGSGKKVLKDEISGVIKFIHDHVIKKL
jgi:acetoin utilization protein AcuC